MFGDLHARLDALESLLRIHEVSYALDSSTGKGAEYPAGLNPVPVEAPLPRMPQKTPAGA